MSTLQPGPTHTPSSQLGGGNVRVRDFEALFLRFQGPITNFIYHLVGNREQASDLAQDVFVKAYKALLGGTEVPTGTLSAWLYGIAANSITNTLRRRSLSGWLPLSLSSGDRCRGACAVSTTAASPVARGQACGELAGISGWMGTPHTQAAQGGYQGGRLEAVADNERIERAFGRLPSRYAICLWLYEHAGLSCAEIAEALTISPSAVKTRLARARERFVTLHRQETGALPTGGIL